MERNPTVLIEVTAEAASIGWSLMASAEAPPSEGTNQHGYAVCLRERDQTYLVSMWVYDERGSAFFQGSTYDMSRESAFSLFADRLPRCA